MGMSTSVVIGKIDMAEQLHPIKFPMGKVGHLTCGVCKQSRAIRHAKWYFEGTEISVKLTLICHNTKCPKSRGTPFVNSYKLINTEDFGKQPNPQPNSASHDFYKQVVSINGIADASANKMISAGITSAKILTENSDEKLEQIGLKSNQIAKIRKKFAVV